MLLHVNQLSIHFHARQGIVKAVEDVSFDLAEGETLGIVGESGCGKTVTALSLLRLISNPPGIIAGGEIFFQGRNLLKLSEKEMCDIRGNHMAMIFQEPMTALHPVLTVGRQVREPLIVHKKAVRKTAVQDCIRLLKRVRIPDADTRLHDYPHQFSGGMRQRVMVAMGLACNPKLIIADEPTTGLDVTLQAELLEFMKGLTQTEKTALVLITHDLGIVACYADQVMIMYAGRIVEKAPTLELYRAPQHPYTQGLLASIPRLDQDIQQKLRPIEGQPPDMANLPSGCAFHPRCPHAKPRCMRELPKLMQISTGHDVACWMHSR